MVIGEAVRTTLVEVWSHKMRSFLTLIGVVLGTMAVVVMVSLIEAVKVEVWRGIDSMGLRGVLFVSQENPASDLDTKRSHLSNGLRAEDAQRLVAAENTIIAAAPIAYTQQIVVWGEHSKSVRLIGTTTQYAEVFGRRAGAGRNLTDIDVERDRRVIVLGHLLAKEIFGSTDPVGQMVSVGSSRFEVIGVLERVGNDVVSDGWSRREMRGAMIPLTTLQSMFIGGRRVPVIVVKTPTTDRLTSLFAYLKNHIWRHHHRVEDFEIENVAAEIVEAEQQIDEQLHGWTWVLFAISAISLVVGGVGIFSVMQISLAERLYEIGLRKSIGAEDRDILIQFMIEAVFLSSLGAVVGLLIAVGLCAAIGPNFEAGLPVSGFAVVLAVAFAIGIGSLAGLYPSMKAARLTPVDALRG